MDSVAAVVKSKIDMLLGEKDFAELIIDEGCKLLDELHLSK